MDDFFRDATVWIYIIGLLISIYGTGLFFWWWARERNASAVFGYVAFLFVGEIFEVGLALYARYLMFLVGNDAYRAFLSSALWPGRKVVTLVAFLCIVIHMTWRVIAKPVYRRRKDGLPALH